MCHFAGEALKSLVWSPVSHSKHGVLLSSWWSHHHVEEAITLRRAILKSHLNQACSCALSHWDIGVVCYYSITLAYRGRPEVEWNVSNLKSNRGVKIGVMVPTHLFCYRWNKNSKMIFNMLQFYDKTQYYLPSTHLKIHYLRRKSTPSPLAFQSLGPLPSLAHSWFTEQR